MATLKVAIVGAGQVGKILGAQLTKHNAAVVKYGTRDPTSDKSKALLVEQPNATVDTVQSSIAWADAVILATPSTAAFKANIQELVASLQPAIQGKVLIDAINAAGWPALELEMWTTGQSTGEALAELLPGTHVFKAFNTIGAHMMKVPDGSTLFGDQLTMLFAGPEEGKVVVEQVISGVGFKPVHVGSIRYSRNLEALAELYIHMVVPGITPSGDAKPVHAGQNFTFQFVAK